MRILLSELMVIHETAKALKQSNFMVHDYKLFGMENPETYLSYVELDKSKVFGWGIKDIGLIFNTRNLSAFLKRNIDEYVELDESIGYHEISVTIGDPLIYTIAPLSRDSVVDMYNRASMIQFKESKDITPQIIHLTTMKVADGGYPLIVDGYKMMTFSKYLPLNKKSRVLLSIYDGGGSSFVSKFDIFKNKLHMTVVVAFLKMQ